MYASAGWTRPSPAVAELIRTAATRLLQAPDELFAEVDAATLKHADPAILADPALVAGIKEANRHNLRVWAEANARDPGAPVRPQLGVEGLGIARDLVRRGLDGSSLDAYRIGQNVSWRQLMELSLTLTADPAELRELLDVNARSVFGYVDAIIAELSDHFRVERDRLTRGTHADRLEVVSLIIDGAPIAPERASARLGYALDRWHTAAIVFSNAATADPGAFEQVAEALARTAGARRPFTVVGSALALWAWIPGENGPPPDAVTIALDPFPDVRVALGPAAEGPRRVPPFTSRRPRRPAPTAADPDGVRAATFDDVQVVTLATHDEERARDFVARTLGALASASPDLRETLRVYLREGSSTVRTARALPAHRNTVVNRLRRAEELLPTPLAQRGLHVALALEIVHWLRPS